MKGCEAIDKGKILGGKRETFEIEGRKQESRVAKKEEGKEEEDKKINYQIMKSEKYQNKNKGGRLNENGKKEKEKYEILQKQKYDQMEKKKKVTIMANYTVISLEKKYVALESGKKKEIIQQIENEKLGGK